MVRRAWKPLHIQISQPPGYMSAVFVIESITIWSPEVSSEDTISPKGDRRLVTGALIVIVLACLCHPCRGVCTRTDVCARSLVLSLLSCN